MELGVGPSSGKPALILTCYHPESYFVLPHYFYYYTQDTAFQWIVNASVLSMSSLKAESLSDSTLGSQQSTKLSIYWMNEHISKPTTDSLGQKDP